MLLSVKRQFLFIHIAKTGGTSIRQALERERWLDSWYWPMALCARFSHWSGHRIGTKLPRHAKVILAKELLPHDHFESLFKFAFVRNPWDLQVSSFHHIRRERPHYLNSQDNFNDFMRWKFDPARPYQYHLDTSIELQRDYLVDLKGQICVDFVGRYEQLSTDFATVCQRLQLPNCELPHRRQATDRMADYRRYYTDETAALVAHHFAADIELFGYQFDLTAPI